MIKDDILDKANKILIEKRIKARELFHKIKRDNRIIEAGLCPVCGEELLNYTEYNKIEAYLKLNNIFSDYDYFYSLKVCNKDNNHYITLEGALYDYDEC